jgi:DNA-binding transcriptional LysR family regulator
MSGLTAFEAVVRFNGFSRAAEELSLTQSAVSHQIASLEKHLGCKLLARTTSGVQPTAVGRVFYEATREALDRLIVASDSIRQQNDKSALTIVATPAFMTWWLVPRVGAFANLQPNIHLNIISTEVGNPIQGGPADGYVALRTSGEVLRDNEIILWDEELFPVCSPSVFQSRDVPLASAEELLDQTLIEEDHLTYTELSWTTWLHHLGIKQTDRTRKLRFSHFSNALAAAIGGFGIAIGRWPLISGELSSGLLIRPLGNTVSIKSTRSFVFGWSANGKNRGAEALRDFLISEVKGVLNK